MDSYNAKSGLGDMALRLKELRRMLEEGFISKGVLLKVISAGTIIFFSKTQV